MFIDFNVKDNLKENRHILIDYSYTHIFEVFVWVKPIQIFPPFCNTTILAAYMNHLPSYSNSWDISPDVKLAQSLQTIPNLLVVYILKLVQLNKFRTAKLHRRLLWLRFFKSSPVSVGSNPAYGEPGTCIHLLLLRECCACWNFRTWKEWKNKKNFAKTMPPLKHVFAVNLTYANYITWLYYSKQSIFLSLSLHNMKQSWWSA